MLKSKIIFIVIFSFFIPQAGWALQMPNSSEILAENLGLSAKSFLVIDNLNDRILISKQPDLLWSPASLTKLVTALVVLDGKPQLTKVVAMKREDEVGGARIATKAGIKYRLKDLLYASLIASANNVTNALARSTGLSKAEFSVRMNEKARSLGAQNTIFYEPTGINEKNFTTALDFAKIVKAAFENPTIAAAVRMQNYSFRSINSRYSHKIKNTNLLLKDPAFLADFTIQGGKTGYLEESAHNFVTFISDRLNNEYIIIVFGSQSSAQQFQETKELAVLAGLSKMFFNVPQAIFSGNAQLTNF